jgi:hypothetical protein
VLNVGDDDGRLHWRTFASSDNPFIRRHLHQHRSVRQIEGLDIGYLHSDHLATFA